MDSETDVLKLLQGWGIHPQQTLSHNSLSLEQYMHKAEPIHAIMLDDLLFEALEKTPNTIESIKDIQHFFEGVTRVLQDHEFKTDVITAMTYNPTFSSCLEDKFLPPLSAAQFFVSVGQLKQLPIFQVLYPGKGSFARWDCDTTINWGHNKKMLFNDETITQQFDITQDVINRRVYLHSLPPSSSLAISLCSLASNLLEDEQLPAAMNLLQLSLTIHPKYVDAYVQRALLHCEQQQFQHALDDLFQATLLDPHDSDLYFNRSKIYSEQGDFCSAVNEMNICVQIDPNPLCYNARGIIYSRVQQYTHAEQDFVKSIELEPRFYLAYSNLAELYLTLELEQKANRTIQQMIAANPMEPAVYLAAADFFKDKGDTEQALNYLQTHNTFAHDQHIVDEEEFFGVDNDDNEYLDYPDLS